MFGLQGRAAARFSGLLGTASLFTLANALSAQAPFQYNGAGTPVAVNGTTIVSVLGRSFRLTVTKQF